MDKILETKRFFKSVTIELLENTVLMKQKSLFDYFELEIDYENIENKKNVIKEVNYGLFVLATIAFIVGMIYQTGNNYQVSLPLLITSVCIITLLFKAKKKMIIINNASGSNILLYFANSNENQVRNFADNIIQCTNDYLLNKYGKIDKDLPVESQLSNIEYLRNRNVINEAKFQELKNQLFDKGSKTIGFGEAKN